MTASLNSSNHFIDQKRSDHPRVYRDHPNLIAVNSEKTNHLYSASPEGRLQIHTAPYRGSFSIVLSEALRAAGLGSRVMVVQFLKGGVNQGPQNAIELCGQLKWLRPAIPYCISQPAQADPANISESNNQE